MHVQPRATDPGSALRVCAWIVRTQGTYAVSLQMNVVVLFNLLFWYTLDSCEPKESLLINCTPPVDGAMECENAVDCVFTPGEAGSCNPRSAIRDSAIPSSEVECLALDPPGDWSPPTHGEFLSSVVIIAVHLCKYCDSCTCLALVHLPASINIHWTNARSQARAPLPTQWDASAPWIGTARACLPRRIV